MDADLSAVDVAVCDLLEFAGGGAAGYRLDRRPDHVFPRLRREPQQALSGLFHTGDGRVRPPARCLGPNYLSGCDCLSGGENLCRSFATGPTHRSPCWNARLPSILAGLLSSYAAGKPALT